MTVRMLFTGIAFLAALGGWAGVDRASRPPRARVVSDTALAELAVGRFWHAARIMQAEGAGDGTPEDVLALARAEAGWGNWAAVLELLADVDWPQDGEDADRVYLLGRALEHAESWEEAARVHGRFLDIVGRDDPQGPAALARRARALWRAGDTSSAVASLGELVAAPAVRSWSAVELTLDAA
ncbi:MAG TPA: hypothetical protein VLA09_13555, partial [Longimicrobiales bacterium]|nr:hypothetical protein [Longimicrobiales bacterium]